MQFIEDEQYQKSAQLSNDLNGYMGSEEIEAHSSFTITESKIASIRSK
jgi:hypothetical protein